MKKNKVFFLFFIVKDRAVYTCESGYRLEGSDKVMCQTSGQWSGAAPRCLPSSGKNMKPYFDVIYIVLLTLCSLGN